MKPYQTLILKGWWVVLLALGTAAWWLGRHAPDLDVEAGTSVLMNRGDADLAYYERTRPLWGYDEYAIVCASGPDWVGEEGRGLLGELAADLARAPYAERVVSLLDVTLLRQQPGPALDVRNLPTLRDPGVDLARAREELLHHTLAVGNLVSADGRITSLLVFLDVPGDLRRLDALRAQALSRTPSPEEAAETARLEGRQRAAIEEQTRRRVALVAEIRRVAAAWEPRLGEPLRLSGLSVIQTNLVEHLKHDLRTFGLAAVGLFLLTFLVIYRRPRFVLLPILTCALPVVLVVGAMAWLDMRVTIITSSLPLLLFVLMLPYTVYFLERYRERQLADPGEPGALSTIRAAPAIFWPCLLSCTTTMAGFVALRTSETRPVREFGLMMAAGMAVGLVVVFLAIPSMSRPLPALRLPSEAKRLGTRRLVELLAEASLRHPAWVVLGGGLLLVLSVVGAARLTAESKFTGYFRTGSEVYQGLEYVDQRLGGTTPLEVHLASPKKGYFLTAPGLAALASVGGYFDDVRETGNVRSLATLVEELKKKNPGILTLLPALARHPKVRAVMSDFANPDYDVARVLVRMRETAPTLDRRRTLDGLAAHLASRPELAGLEVRPTGVFLLYSNMLESLLATQRETFLWVVGAVFAMVVGLFRSLILSAVVLATQVLPTMVTLGTMGWAGIPLDLVTVMISGIAMGVGIDASIQYAYRYRDELSRTGDRREAIRRTHGTVGRAIWIATTVIVCGFLVLLLSDFTPSVWFGLLNAVAMVVSQVSALTILPALLLLTRQPRAPGPGSRGSTDRGGSS